jgi:hypothetical protein
MSLIERVLNHTKEVIQKTVESERLVIKEKENLELWHA